MPFPTQIDPCAQEDCEGSPTGPPTDTVMVPTFDDDFTPSPGVMGTFVGPQEAGVISGWNVTFDAIAYNLQEGTVTDGTTCVDCSSELIITFTTGAGDQQGSQLRVYHLLWYHIPKSEHIVYFLQD